MASTARARKIGERVQEELASILVEQVSDPRLQMITITGVDVDRELAFASIYVTAIGDDDRSKEVLKGQNIFRGFTRK